MHKMIPIVVAVAGAFALMSGPEDPLIRPAAFAAAETVEVETLEPIVLSSSNAIPVNYVDVEAYVRDYFADIPVMIRVIECESTFTQWTESGVALMSHLGTADQGAAQINLYYHEARAESLGHDLTTLEGNLDYARYLYDTKGLQPWSASRHCWSR